VSAATRPQSVLITGATGGIGGALAMVYAEPGSRLILQGRKSARLAELAAACELRGARVLTEVLDLRDRQALANWLKVLSEKEPLDLVIVNAGVNTPRAAFDQLKATLHRLARAGDPRRTEPGFLARLSGQIAWVEQVNPARGARLRTRFDAL